MIAGLAWIILIVIFVEVRSESSNEVESGEIVSSSDLRLTYSKLCVDEHGRNVYGAIAYKTDCRKFVQCAPDLAMVVCCQPGLLFNRATRACDWPKRVNCIEFEGVDPSKLVIPATSISWNEVIVK